MRINGVWVGLGYGDSSEETRRVKTYLRRKFSYAASLADTPLYDEAMRDVVAEVQRRYQAAGKLAADAYIPGVLNLETRVVMGYLQRPNTPPRRPIVFTVEGHMSNMFAGPVADTATALEREGLCHHQPIGYNNGAIPFDNGSGVRELARLVSATTLDNLTPFPAGTPWALAGFSQGGIVITDFWLDYLAPGKPLAWRTKDLRAVLAYGNPCRQAGSVAPWAIPWISDTQTQGLDPARRFGAPGYPGKPEYWVDVYRAGDIFAENGGDSAAALKAAVYQAVARGKVLLDPLSLGMQIADRLDEPIDLVLAIIKAIASGVGFLGRQPNPHYSPYDIRGGVDWLRAALAADRSAAA